MSLTPQHAEQIADVLRNSLRSKLLKYKPEPNSMPFHTRLLGADRMALFSFIHSLNTQFRTAIFEPVALAIATLKFKNARKQYTGMMISEGAHRVIQDIIDDLSVCDTKADKVSEVEKIRQVCQSGNLIRTKFSKATLVLETHKGELFYFDFKPAKPPIQSFREFKQTLLEQVAVVLAHNPHAQINTAIAIPYNPYAPAPYERWRMKGMLDFQHEVLIAEDFWNFLAGDNIFEDLLDIFERVGIELIPDIDKAFEKYQLVFNKRLI